MSFVFMSLLPCWPPQELEGAFMIAFDRAGDAAEWCLLLQEVMMEVRRGRRGRGDGRCDLV